MKPRTSNLDRFSTFAELELKNEGYKFRRWAIDGELRRNMQKYLTDQADRSERLWSLYWFQQWQSQASPLAESHLIAYLQEPCYWVADKMAKPLQSGNNTLADYFQIVHTDIRKVLIGFSIDRGSSLKSYAELVLTNSLKDNLRQRQAVDICSDWALLRKWSKKRITEVLDQVGMTESEIAQYQLAWFSFKTCYSPNDSAGEKFGSPNAAHWQKIAEFYNTQRLRQLVEPSVALTPSQIEVKLGKLARWLRNYLYPTIKSLNSPKRDEAGGEIQDDLPNDSGGNTLDIMIEEDEIDQRSNQLRQIQDVLEQAVKDLVPEQQEILQLFYQQKLSQQELASHLKLSQPTVSRRLKKAEESLWQALLTWIETQLNHFPDPNILKSISVALREWLNDYYANLEPGVICLYF